MISIVDYGSGNIQAIANVYHRLGVPFVIVSRPNELAEADQVILPGVGAFDQAMFELEKSGMRHALHACVLEEKKPILGICVGMQLLARSSEEGAAKGLGWIDAEVKRFENGSSARQVPHMGWNTVEPKIHDALFEGVEFQHGFYFLHSYYLSCGKEEDELASTNYGVRFTSAVMRGNVYGVQFHPEKSHQNGVRLLKNFALL